MEIKYLIQSFFTLYQISLPKNKRSTSSQALAPVELLFVFANIPPKEHDCWGYLYYCDNIVNSYLFGSRWWRIRHLGFSFTLCTEAAVYLTWVSCSWFSSPVTSLAILMPFLSASSSMVDTLSNSACGYIKITAKHQECPLKSPCYFLSCISCHRKVQMQIATQSTHI